MRRAPLALRQVALAVVERRGRVLICRRRPQDHLGGYWEFPGGTRRRSETWEACLRRELREELGVDIRALRPLGELAHRTAKTRLRFKVFRCTIARGRPRALAAETIRWVLLGRLRRYRFPPADAGLVRGLSGGLQARRRRAIM